MFDHITSASNEPYIAEGNLRPDYSSKDNQAVSKPGSDHSNAAAQQQSSQNEGHEGVAEHTTERSKEQELYFPEFKEVTNRFEKAVKFKVFEQSGDIYAQVINASTEEVIRNIPSEESLETMSRIRKILGLTVDELS